MQEAKTVTHDNRVMHEEFIRSELAVEAIAEMIGSTTLAMLAEEEKAVPDREKLAQLKGDIQKYRSEREAIYRGDEQVQQRCIDEYGPIIKRRYGK